MGTISKALNLLNYFSESSSELGLMDFKSLTGQDKATIHRHLGELEENGFLEQNVENRKYRLGAAVLRLSAIREATFPVKRIVAPSIKKLAEELGELVHASAIQNYGMSSIHFHDGGFHGTRVFFSRAEMLPLHATASGLVALAYGPPSLKKKVLASKLASYTKHTITDADLLESCINKIREDGFAYSDQIFEDEVSSLAVPFFENGEFATGAISLAMPSSRMKDADKFWYLTKLQQTAQIISNDLGGDVPLTLRRLWKMTNQEIG